MPDLPTLLMIQQVAEQLKVSPETVRRHVRARRMGCYRLGGTVRISPEQVTEFLALCLSPATPPAVLLEAAEQPRLESAVEAFRRKVRIERVLDRRRAKP